MAAAIYEYEIEVKVRHETSGAERIMSIRQHAYGVSDAVLQAGYAFSQTMRPGEIISGILRVGPPQEAVLESMSNKAFNVGGGN